MKVNILDSGIYEFIDLCQKENINSIDVEQLLKNESYNSMIQLMGQNWGIGLHESWKTIFMCAFNQNYDQKISNIQSMYVNHLKNAIHSLTNLKKLVSRIKSIIESNDFFTIVNQYAYTDKLETLNIHLLIFGPNAGGNQDIILDILFLEPLTDNEISRIIAHELHHIIRSKYEINYYSNHEEILQMAFWLESEGCANLCNYESSIKFYELYGYVKKDVMIQNLNNIKNSINQINDLIMNNYLGHDKHHELYNFLATDLLFHTLGYFMAKTIYEVSASTLKDTVGNPLKFINVYQNICKNKNIGYPLKDETINILNKTLSRNN
ncbi:MAG: hypothetical protein IKY26_08270 [Erysipelotrichaceae bacterium]|nr:hypothetical protein [Erysipelotrichaceae bacterium]